MFIVLLNSKLAEKVRKIRVVGNEYVLREFTEGVFHASACEGDPGIDYVFTEDELRDKWVVLRPTSASGFHMRFSEEKPQRFYEALDVESLQPITSALGVDQFVKQNKEPCG